jgi:hypothetical protein
MTSEITITIKSYQDLRDLNNDLQNRLNDLEWQIIGEKTND